MDHNGLCRGQMTVVIFVHMILEEVGKSGEQIIIIIIIYLFIFFFCNYICLIFHNWWCKKSGAEFWTPTAILQSRLVPQILTYSNCYLYLVVFYFCKAIFTVSVLVEIKFKDPHPRHLHDYGTTNNIQLTHWGRVTQICVFTLQLCKTDDTNLRF